VALHFVFVKLKKKKKDDKESDKERGGGGGGGDNKQKQISNNTTTTPTSAPKTVSSSSSSSFLKPTTEPSTFSGFGSQSVSSVKYDLNGDLDEQAREAIKGGDVPGTISLLKAGANANYKDRTGNTLLHLAAMFNRLDLVTLLVRNGADINAKNPTGETPIDVAPASLGNKMKQQDFAKA
jgi:hypothetical protein